MINKKRGYKSSRKAKGTEEGTLIDGMEVAKKLYEDSLTPGQLCLGLLRDGRKYLPDFYRSDLQVEFDRIWGTQREFYPDVLTDALKEELHNKKRDAVWAICARAFKEKGVELVGTKRQGNTSEQKIENYVLRAKGLTDQLDLEQFVIALQQINIQITSSSGYLGAISDRSKELYFNEQTVGQYQMAVLDENPNASLRNMVFYRQDYLDEFNTIWETQAKFHPELTEELKQEIRDVVIFYQRRLKSQKGLIGFCEFESRRIEVEIDGKKKIKTVGSRVIPRSSPLFQEFRIWQTLNNLEISAQDVKARYKKKKDNYPSLFAEQENPLELHGKRGLYQEEKELLAQKLADREKLTKTELLKHLFNDPKNYDLNFKDIQGNLTRAKLVQACPQVAELSDEESYALWHLLYSFEGDNSNTGNKKLIDKLAARFGQECAAKLAGIAFQDDYGSLSAKAIGKILPYLKEGNTYDVACEYAGYRHSKASLKKEEIENKTYKDRLDVLPKNSLRNPVVEKILNQMVNVINTIIDTYGKPDEIRIELARELKKNAKEREALTSSISETTKVHDGYRKTLTAPPFNLSYISRNDIIRYKLYEELKDNGYKTLYSDTYISPAALFSGDFDIEHIIPQARLFDDSFSNKTLELRSVNLEKGSRTACDFVKEKYGDEGLDRYMDCIERLFKDKRAKLKKLKMEEKDIPEDFLSRDLGNTQYITKYAKTMLGDLVKRVVSTTGSITDVLRKDWQLVDVMKELNWDKYYRLGLTYYDENRDGKKLGRIRDWTKRNDHRHHAMDALTVAFTKDALIQLFNNRNASLKPNSNEFTLKAKHIENGKVRPPMPLNEFRTEAKKHLENTLISIKAKNKVVTRNVNTTNKNGGTNKKTQLTPRGQLHNETIYGSLQQYKKNKKGEVSMETIYTIRKEVSADLKIDKVIDKKIRERLEARLAEYGGDAKRAFLKATLEENPIWLNEEKGIAVKRVTISGISNAESLHDKRDKDGRLILDEKGNKQPVDFVSTSNNHHVAIYSVPVLDKKGNHEQDEQGNPKYELQEKVVSFYEAVARRNQGLPVIDKEYRANDGWKFLFTMKQNEYFVFLRIEKHEKVNEETGEILDENVVTFDPREVDLLDSDNYAMISPNLFRVRKLQSKEYVFQHHLETKAVDLSAKNPLKNIAFQIIYNPNGLKTIVKVRINHIGQIVSVGEY